MLHWQKFLDEALIRRTTFIKKLKNEGTNAYRLFAGSREGISGLCVDLYDTRLVINIYEGKYEGPSHPEIALWYQNLLPITDCSCNSRTAKSQTSYDIGTNDIPVPKKCVISEYRIRYLVEPHNISTGLFLDQRENRKFIAERSKKKEVLNCFSYTCSFSVACALNGAHITSVDLSKKALQWGRENFLLNNIDEEIHTFVSFDIFDYFKMAKRRQQYFDLIIIDPPTFSRTASKKVFTLKKDWKRLLGEAVLLLKSGGELFFSNNYASWHLNGFRSEVLSFLGQDFEMIRLPNTPFDFLYSENPLNCIHIKMKQL